MSTRGSDLYIFLWPYTARDIYGEINRFYWSNFDPWPRHLYLQRGHALDEFTSHSFWVILSVLSCLIFKHESSVRMYISAFRIKCISHTAVGIFLYQQSVTMCKYAFNSLRHHHNPNKKLPWLITWMQLPLMDITGFNFVAWIFCFNMVN